MEECSENFSEFIVESEIERLNYLMTASEEKTQCFVTIMADNKEEIYSFNSKMFLAGQEDLELIWKTPGNIKTESIKTNCILKITFDLHGIKTNAECFLRSLRFKEEDIILNISGPYRMQRIQRRKRQRVILSSKFSATVSLNKELDFLSNLLVANISDCGVALLINAPKEYLERGLIYENAEIILPLKMNNSFSLDMRICHVEQINKSLLPVAMRDKSVNNNWYKVGIEFRTVTPKMEHSLLMVMNAVFRSGHGY
jgi:c-di-GMP-binding flagellar brake protein YcgR